MPFSEYQHELDRMRTQSIHSSSEYSNSLFEAEQKRSIPLTVDMDAQRRQSTHQPINPSVCATSTKVKGHGKVDYQTVFAFSPVRDVRTLPLSVCLSVCLSMCVSAPFPPQSVPFSVLFFPSLSIIHIPRAPALCLIMRTVPSDNFASQRIHAMPCLCMPRLSFVQTDTQARPTPPPSPS